jgi:ribosome-associated protein
MMMTAEEIAAAVGEYATDVKAEHLLTLDLREYISYTDYFVICTGRSDRQVKAIHDRVAEGMKREHEMRPIRVDGTSSAQWILMDYGDVVLHIFTPEMREYYQLERLWGEAPQLELAQA